MIKVVNGSKLKSWEHKGFVKRWDKEVFFADDVIIFGYFHILGTSDVYLDHIIPKLSGRIYIITDHAPTIKHFRGVDYGNVAFVGEWIEKDGITFSCKPMECEGVNVFGIQSGVPLHSAGKYVQMYSRMLHQNMDVRKSIHFLSGKDLDTKAIMDIDDILDGSTERFEQNVFERGRWASQRMTVGLGESFPALRRLVRQVVMFNIYLYAIKTKAVRINKEGSIKKMEENEAARKKYEKAYRERLIAEGRITVVERDKKDKRRAMDSNEFVHEDFRMQG